MKLLVDKRFNTSVERTDRVLEVAEAFGIGLDDREFVVFDNFELDVNRGDVVYITGQSGSGKSLLLRAMAGQLAEQGRKVASIDDVVLPEQPLVDQVGATTQEALELLSRVGLNDAYLFIRKPSELSDGQRYRLRLAHLISMGADTWVADEFGAVLDRITAKIVAYSLQRQARKSGVTLIVATTHTDLEMELGPNILVQKRFRERIHVSVDTNVKGQLTNVA